MYLRSCLTMTSRELPHEVSFGHHHGIILIENSCVFFQSPLHASIQFLIPRTQLLCEDVRGPNILLDVWEMACVFIRLWFHLTHGPPSFNDTFGHKRFRPLTTMFIPLSQLVGKVEASAHVAKT